MRILAAARGELKVLDGEFAKSWSQSKVEVEVVKVGWGREQMKEAATHSRWFELLGSAVVDRGCAQGVEVPGADPSTCKVEVLLLLLGSYF